MGGLGSGRYGYGQKPKVDAMQRIELAFMRQKNILRTGSAGTFSWSRNGEPSGSIRYITLEYGLRLNYRSRSHGEEEWRDIEETVPFVWTTTAFGGRRRWFECLRCRRRCSILYGGARFRCRRCCGLVYETQYETSWQRAVTKAQKIRLRLGADGSMDEPFPVKPKGMHWKTYYRLDTIDSYAQDVWASLIIRWLDGGSRRR